MPEFELIERIRARAGGRDDVVLGIGDDAALLRVPPDRQLVVAMDTLNDGVHFPRGTAAADVGWKALAVNLSDLAAMGAEPAWCTLSLSLPASDDGWVDGFLDGFLKLATAHRVALVGGDTTRGPLSICVTMHGLVEPGRALRRDAARAGDAVWASGSLGDAGAALALLDAGATPPAALRERLDRPTPRIALGRALGGVAAAAIDVSDGLLADLDHVCAASGVGMRIALDALPASDALLAACDAAARTGFQTGGGDDYELAFTTPPDADAAVRAAALGAGVAVTRIGEVVTGERVRLFDDSGREWMPTARGYAHFAAND
ncbi:thiamine-phosphate kinase [Marilutibacter maris]|uniref:Thiamine-monophosphate kinase n=3 Tax=Marilutibacter maris TaxID=1605891 RepID=A0A2U9T4H6_9GAMM|nr:thiamine-phosphate kinase [Lysobacter maris]AWV06472.1 thiamine-monophosphate kinase [Lysobacter maris]